MSAQPFVSWQQDSPAQPKKVAFVVERADYVQQVLVHYVGEDVPRNAPVYRAGDQIVVPLPLLRSGCVVRLVVGDTKNDNQQTFDGVQDYFDSCGDPVSAFEMGSGNTE